MKAKTKPTAKTVKKAPKKKTARLVTRDNGLLPKQAAFVREYLIDGNATQAAIRAGYSEKTAYNIGAENLKKPQIAKLIAEKQVNLQKEHEERVGGMALTKDRVALEIARLAFFDPRKMFDAEGNPKPITELDDDTAAAIGGLEVMEQFEGSGKDRVFVGYLKKYKISDKNSALDKAAKHLGMFKEDNEQAGKGVVNALASLLAGMGKSSLAVVPDEPQEPGQ